MNSKLLSQSIAFISVCTLSNVAFGQLATIRESIMHPTSAALELKPLPTAVSVVPGVASIGAGIELSAGSNFASFLNGYILDANLPNRLRPQNSEDNQPGVHKMRGFAGDLGGRYYSDGVNTDSWYGGAKVGYALSMTQWGYKGQTVDHAMRTITPGLEGGYRWVWVNNLLLRIGAGADGNVIQQNTVTPTLAATDVTNDAKDRIEGYAKVAVVPRVDLGLGYAF